MRRYVHGPTPALLALAAAAALIPAAPAAHADDGGAPCAPSGPAFPLTTRIHGGPTAYEAGGGYGTWYLDLTNTTRFTCAGIHPVVVLVDERRALRPTQPRLEFYDGPRIHAVRFETTDEDELVGALDGKGFTVPPGRTVTVKVRLTFASDTAPNEVTANAAVVQRHGDDGDWVGQSADYRFGIDTEPAAPSGTATPEGLPFGEEAQQLAGTGAAVAALAATALLLAVGGAFVRARGRR